MFLSVGVRAVVNIEALNMVESIGNFVRHRKAMIIFKQNDRYVIRNTPVVSGESIAHAYQWWVAGIARERYKEVPLCEYCERGEFLKHCDTSLFGTKKWEEDLKKKIESKKYDPHEIEKEIVKNCIVEDLGGFLYPGVIPVKRTSVFQNSYMVPTFDSLSGGLVSIDPQFHARHSPTRSAKQEQEEAVGQSIYYVETGSAIYSLTFNLDLNAIGRTRMIKLEDVVGEDERKRRIGIALDALAIMLDSKIFGAKLSRFTPVIHYETIIAAVSQYPPFVVSAPASPDFIDTTISRANAFKELFGSEVNLFGLGDSLPKEIEVASNVLELLNKVKGRVLGEKDEAVRCEGSH